MNRLEPRQDKNNAYLVISRTKDANPVDKNTRYSVNNLSRGGIRFCSKEPFEIDEIVHLMLYIDEKLSHSASGRICYHDQNQPDNSYYGVSFLDKFLHL